VLTLLLCQAAWWRMLTAAAPRPSNTVWHPLLVPGWLGSCGGVLGDQMCAERSADLI
jgi:hypothetical protein